MYCDRLEEVSGIAHILSKSQAARVYDRIGRFQDTQRFYEDPATKALVSASRMDEASALFEAGCGTGRLAQKLLSGVLPPQCTYLGVDISATMVRLARRAVAPWSQRATVLQADATTYQADLHLKFDRFLTAFCVDLLSPEDIAALLLRARAALIEGGMLCAAGLTDGPSGLESWVSRAWSACHRVAPQLLGGCRPLHLCHYLDRTCWRTLHHETICAFGLCSEVLVAYAI